MNLIFKDMVIDDIMSVGEIATQLKSGDIAIVKEKLRVINSFLCDYELMIVKNKNTICKTDNEFNNKLKSVIKELINKDDNLESGESIIIKTEFISAMLLTYSRSSGIYKVIYDIKTNEIKLHLADEMADMLMRQFNKIDVDFKNRIYKDYFAQIKTDVIEKLYKSIQCINTVGIYSEKYCKETEDALKKLIDCINITIGSNIFRLHKRGGIYISPVSFLIESEFNAKASIINDYLNSQKYIDTYNDREKESVVTALLKGVGFSKININIDVESNISLMIKEDNYKVILQQLIIITDLISNVLKPLEKSQNDNEQQLSNVSYNIEELLKEKFNINTICKVDVESGKLELDLAKFIK